MRRKGREEKTFSRESPQPSYLYPCHRNLSSHTLNRNSKICPEINQTTIHIWNFEHFIWLCAATNTDLLISFIALRYIQMEKRAHSHLTISLSFSMARVLSSFIFVYASKCLPTLRSLSSNMGFIFSASLHISFRYAY